MTAPLAVSRPKPPTLTVCATCPFLKGNLGKKHAAGWYTLTNIRRLWNGLRTGKCPGMVCHSTDQSGVEYGSEKVIPEGTPRLECAGALILVIRHINEAGRFQEFKDYQAQHRRPLTKRGLGAWLNRLMFNQPEVIDNENIGLPPNI